MKIGRTLRNAAAVILVVMVHFNAGAATENSTINLVEATAGRVELSVLKSVVKIVSTFGPEKASIGTGFLVSRATEKAAGSEKEFYLVTNKHVVSDWDLSDGTITKYSQAIDVYFYRTSDPDGATYKPRTIQISDATGKPFASKLALHPNPAIDVAAVLLNDELAPANKIELASFDKSFFVTFAQCINFAGVGDQVFALGYPLGISSLTTNLPIAKAGYIASVPGQEFKIDVPTIDRAGHRVIAELEGKYLVVDGLIVRGNSGGPVVIPAERKARIDPRTTQLQFSSEPTKNFVVGIVSTALGGSGLTIVVSSDYILELIDALP
jgi:Trypsin-like peptidase domain